jgi:hypothetical protein
MPRGRWPTATSSISSSVSPSTTLIELPFSFETKSVRASAPRPATEVMIKTGKSRLNMRAILPKFRGPWSLGACFFDQPSFRLIANKYGNDNLDHGW